PEAIAYHDGAFICRDDATRRIDLPALARGLAQSGHELPSGEGDVANAPITFPQGCHVAEVEVDPQTGRVTLARYLAVDDFGTLVNPLLAEGQVQGGLAQGI